MKLKAGIGWLLLPKDFGELLQVVLDTGTQEDPGAFRHTLMIVSLEVISRHSTEVRDHPVYVAVDRANRTLLVRPIPDKSCEIIGRYLSPTKEF